MILCIIQPDGLCDLAEGGYQLGVHRLGGDMKNIGYLFIAESFLFYQLKDQLASLWEGVDSFFHFFSHLRIDAYLFGVVSGKAYLHMDAIESEGWVGLSAFQDVQAFVPGNDKEPDPDVLEGHYFVAMFPKGDHRIGGGFF